MNGYITGGRRSGNRGMTEERLRKYLLMNPQATVCYVSLGWVRIEKPVDGVEEQLPSLPTSNNPQE